MYGYLGAILYNVALFDIIKLQYMTFNGKEIGKIGGFGKIERDWKDC